MTATPADPRAALEERIAARDRSGAVRLALEAVEGGLTIPCLYARVLAPLMEGVGARWQSGELAVWEEHFASATVRTIIDALHLQVAALAPAERGRGTALVACPPQEQHDLGSRMLADRMELAGWRVFFLGADTPAAEIAAAVVGLGADTVLLSVATHYHRVMLRSFVDGLRAELPGVRILVGGRAFDRDTAGWGADELADEADLTAGGGAC